MSVAAVAGCAPSREGAKVQSAPIAHEGPGGPAARAPRWPQAPSQAPQGKCTKCRSEPRHGETSALLPTSCHPRLSMRESSALHNHKGRGHITPTFQWNPVLRPERRCAFSTCSLIRSTKRDSIAASGWKRWERWISNSQADRCCQEFPAARAQGRRSSPGFSHSSQNHLGLGCRSSRHLADLLWSARSRPHPVSRPASSALQLLPKRSGCALDSEIMNSS